MKRIVKMPGCLLKVGDIVYTAGYRYLVVTTPHMETTLSGIEKWAFQAKAMNPPLNLPYGTQIVGMSMQADLLWSVEFGG